MAALRFSVASAMHVELSIYDITGRRVAVLRDGFTGPGDYTATWYGTDESGAEVGPGVYLARLAAGGQVVSRKLVRLK
jgi:flagellar hook assembly protein FlgD